MEEVGEKRGRQHSSACSVVDCLDVMSPSEDGVEDEGVQDADSRQWDQVADADIDHAEEDSLD